MKNLINFFNKNKAISSEQVGLIFRADGIAMATAKMVDGKVHLTDCFFQPYEPQNKSQTFAQLVQKHKVEQGMVTFTMQTNDYQLLLTSPPEVPDEEIPSAIRWQIKDLVTHPIEESVISVFRLYDDAQKPYKNFIYAAVTEKEKVEEYIHLSNLHGFKIHAIDIMEFAMRNLMNYLSDDSHRHVAVLHLEESHGTITVFSGNELCLSRHISSGYQQLKDNDSNIEMLSLEIQRSFDFFEGQLRRTPVTKLFVAPMPSGVSEGLLEKLDKLINAQIAPINLKDVIQFDCDVDEKTLIQCLPAIGGSLRAFVEAT